MNTREAVEVVGVDQRDELAVDELERGCLDDGRADRHVQFAGGGPVRRLLRGELEVAEDLADHVGHQRALLLSETDAALFDAGADRRLAHLDEPVGPGAEQRRATDVGLGLVGGAGVVAAELAAGLAPDQLLVARDGATLSRSQAT
jgi:hypothetical protein